MHMNCYISMHTTVVSFNCTCHGGEDYYIEFEVICTCSHTVRFFSLPHSYNLQCGCFVKSHHYKHWEPSVCVKMNNLVRICCRDASQMTVKVASIFLLCMYYLFITTTECTCPRAERAVFPSAWMGHQIDPLQRSGNKDLQTKAG